MGIDIATSPIADTAVSGRYTGKSSPNSQKHPSKRSSVSSSLSLQPRFHLKQPQPQLAVVYMMMTLLFAMMDISNPNSYHHVHSLSIVSKTSTLRRPTTTNFAIPTFHTSIQKQRSHIQQLQFSSTTFLLFQSSTDTNESENNGNEV